MRAVAAVSNGAVAVVLLGVLSGCNTSALTEREIVINFNDSTTQATRIADRQACLHPAPNVSAEPLPAASDKFVSDQINDVRYRVDHANDNEISKLYACFENKPGVLGFSDDQDANG